MIAHDAFTWFDHRGAPQSPVVLPLPVVVQTITQGTPVTLGPEVGPLYLKLTYSRPWYWWLTGLSLSFTASSIAPFNLGIYGPNPTSIGPPFGRERAPKLGLPDGTNNSCAGNFTSGTYYLVLRNGSDGAPLAPITVSVK
jgi:hypothetical protein